MGGGANTFGVQMQVSVLAFVTEAVIFYRCFSSKLDSALDAGWGLFGQQKTRSGKHCHRDCHVSPQVPCILRGGCLETATIAAVRLKHTATVTGRLFRWRK